MLKGQICLVRLKVLNKNKIREKSKRHKNRKIKSEGGGVKTEKE